MWADSEQLRTCIVMKCCCCTKDDYREGRVCLDSWLWKPQSMSIVPLVLGLCTSGVQAEEVVYILVARSRGSWCFNFLFKGIPPLT